MDYFIQLLDSFNKQLTISYISFMDYSCDCAYKYSAQLLLHVIAGEPNGRTKTRTVRTVLQPTLHSRR